MSANFSLTVVSRMSALNSRKRIKETELVEVVKEVFETVELEKRSFAQHKKDLEILWAMCGITPSIELESLIPELGEPT